MTTGKIGDIGKAIGQRFGPFLALFGSATAVSALLLAAGFLSDFGAYHVASLPRLHFSLTALAETGAQILIDAVALMLSSPWRAALLLVALVALLLAWALRDRYDSLRQLARSVAAYRFARLATFIFAALLLGSMVDRVQSSLSGEDRGSAAVESALRGAYATHFPDPWEREFAIERKTYALRYFLLPNLGARLDRAWDDLWGQVSEWTGIYWLKSGNGDHDITGIPLRRLPEAREEARHVFGWVALFVVLLLALNALLRWWGGAVGDATRAESDLPASVEPLGAGEAKESGAPPVDGPRGWRGSLRSWGSVLALDGWASPIERILSPLTAFMTVIALLLLPLLHGVLARTALGGETVMVFTVDKDKAQPDKGDGEEEGRNGDASAINVMTGGCRRDALDAVEQNEKALDKALRAALQAHPAHGEEERKAALQTYKSGTRKLAESALEAKCPDAVALMWSARPSLGTAVQEPELAEFFWNELRRVSDALHVQIGVILGYPREGQSLSLVDSVVPPREAIAGQWSVLDLPAERIGHVVVLPGRLETLRRRLAKVDAQVRANSADDSLEQLLVKSGEQSLEVVLKLVEDNVLHSNAVGVAATTLGSMAYVASRDRPRLTQEAIDLLVDLAKPTPSAFWPRKSVSLRGAAVTSIALTRSPYAAYRLAEALEAEQKVTDCKPTSNEAPPLHCIDQTPSAVGLLMDALAVEQRYQPVAPARVLLQTRDRLLNYLVTKIQTEGMPEDVRNATCTAIQLAGRLPNISEQQRKRFWDIMSASTFAQRPISSGSCILAMWPLGLDGDTHRAWLHDVAAGTHPWLAEGSTLGATDRTLIRVAALMVLGKQGISGEESLIFDIYSQTANSHLRTVAANLLDETNAVEMSDLLFACGEDESLDTARRLRCIEGIRRVHNSYKGDNRKASERARDLARNADPSIAKASCSVLREFNRRGGKWVLRNGESDDVVARCLGDGGGLAALLGRLPENKRREIEKELEALSPEERSVLESALPDGAAPSPQAPPDVPEGSKGF